MLNKSCLTRDVICRIMCYAYNITNICYIVPLETGSACIFKLQLTNDEKYILKEFQKGYSYDDIVEEIEIVSHLRQNGINSSVFIPTINNKYVYQYKDRFLTLQKYIDGNTYEANTASLNLMDNSAILLGKIHNALETYTSKKYRFTKEWINKDIIENKKDLYRRLLNEATSKRDEYTERIIYDLQYKLANIDNINWHNWINCRNITYANSHGDYSILQLICVGDNINAVIDFSSSCNLPVVWEIIRSFTYGDKDCAAAIINISSLKRYILCYLKERTLSEEDIANIFKIYSSQLMMSSFGYKEYFMAETVNKKQIINFAFWRTRLLRYIIDHEEDMTNELLKWFTTMI